MIVKDVTNKMCICLSFIDLYDTVDNTVNDSFRLTLAETQERARIYVGKICIYIFFLYMYVDFLIFSGDTVDTTIPDAFQFDSV